MKKLILYTCCSATQYYNCHTILKCKFDFVNSKWKKSLVWENPVNSNICVRENKCISLSPSTCLNRHHIPRFSLICLVPIFTGVDGPIIADIFYENLFHKGKSATVDALKPDTSQGARALHIAVAKL